MIYAWVFLPLAGYVVMIWGLWIAYVPLLEQALGLGFIRGLN